MYLACRVHGGCALVDVPEEDVLGSAPASADPSVWLDRAPFASSLGRLERLICVERVLPLELHPSIGVDLIVPDGCTYSRPSMSSLRSHVVQGSAGGFFSRGNKRFLQLKNHSLLNPEDVQ